MKLFRRKPKPFCADLAEHLEHLPQTMTPLPVPLTMPDPGPPPRPKTPAVPSDAEIRAWIARNPDEFGRWLARYNRMRGY